MALNKVEICGVNTSKLPSLTEAEKTELFRRIKNGDREAREEYVRGNLRLVLSVIKRFAGSNENPDDLFQIGCIGLMKAVDNFNTELDVKFSTYAVPMIIGEIRRFLRDNNSIRVSRSLKDTAYKAIYARENLTRKNLKEPTINEIAEDLNLRFRFNGAWFFQLKENGQGQFRLMEVAPRIAGTMGATRNRGVNMPLLTLYNMWGYDVDIIDNGSDLLLDRAFISRFKSGLRYENVYVDFDDTMVLPQSMKPLEAAWTLQLQGIPMQPSR